MWNMEVLKKGHWIYWKIMVVMDVEINASVDYTCRKGNVEIGIMVNH